MRKKVVVLGGGTGLSTLLMGLKEFPLDISAVVSVSDDGSSTGRLRKEFNIPAVGDIRKVLVSLSETEPLFEKLLNYRFNTSSDLNGHTVGNLLLTAASDITGNMSEGINAVSRVLNLKGEVLPLTEDNVILMGKMEDGSIVEGEHNITDSKLIIKDVFYKEKPRVNPSVIKAVREADLVILSMGSVFTSIIPNLICKEVQEALEKSSASIMYVCNMMTQPGETDNFSVSHHIKLLNKYLGKRQIDVAIVNNGSISKELLKKYETLEQKDPVYYDEEKVKKLNTQIISSDFIMIRDGNIRHDYKKLAAYI
ncbi:MAG TPA: gluconeogenesis factor YvcK family protein, partial [Patescibacteria group bacterium]|nr:gluconeogenesis factor YvcK family protein [Patescibacteria group bacterium]